MISIESLLLMRTSCYFCHELTETYVFHSVSALILKGTTGDFLFLIFFLPYKTLRKTACWYSQDMDRLSASGTYMESEEVRTCVRMKWAPRRKHNGRLCDY